MNESHREEVVKNIRKNGVHYDRGFFSSTRIIPDGNSKHGVSLAEEKQTPEQSFRNSLTGESLAAFRKKIANILKQ